MQEEKSSKWPKYAVYSLIVIIILLLILALILYLVKSPLIYRSSAFSSTSSTSTGQSGIPPALSLSNSYIFASPLRAKAGREKIRVTVFVLDARGLGLSGKKVAIGTGGTLSVTVIQSETDGQGRATFDVASDSIGAFVLEATADGTKLNQQASISFD